MKSADVAELWGRYRSFEKRANDLLKEDINKYGYDPARSAVRHMWHAKSVTWNEAAHDLCLWASEKDKAAIRNQESEGYYEYEEVSPSPPAICVHVDDSDDDES